MIFHKKKKQYDIDMKTANQTLQNVFAACNQEPNTIPFEKIVLRQKARTLSMHICMWLSLIFLILTLLTPLCFRNEIFQVRDVNDASYHYMTVVDHYFEGDYFTIKLKGENIDYDNVSITYENGNKGAPDEVIPSDNLIRIYKPEGTLNILIPDLDGHSIIAVLTVDE